jgi:hypothetical protein
MQYKQNISQNAGYIPAATMPVNALCVRSAALFLFFGLYPPTTTEKLVNQSLISKTARFLLSSEKLSLSAVKVPLSSGYVTQ